MLLSTVLLSSAAEAHHIVSQYGIAPAEPVTRASLQLEVRSFDFDAGPAGTAQIATPRLQYAPLEWLSGTARMPLAAVQYDAEADTFGIGDLSVGATARLFATEHGGLILSAGLGSEIPTGSVEDGLGGGHFELAPFVIASSSPVENVVLFGSVTDQFSLGGDPAPSDQEAHGHNHSHDHPHGSAGPSDVHGAVIAPHEDHELRSRVGGAYVVDPFYVSVSNALVYAWSREDPFGPYVVSAELGWRPFDRFRLALGTDVPIIGPDRFSWLTQIAGSWTF